MNKVHNAQIKFALCGSLALGICLFATATAQETQERLSSDTVLIVGARENEPAAGYKPDVIATTGPWGSRKVEEVPYTITVLPSELIENSGARNLDQLFAMTPLVQQGQSQDINNIAQATLRGFNVARAYVNGVQNNNIGMGVFVEEIDQLEILNGLSGFLYGASPVGGVINYQLKSPTAYDLRDLTIGNYGGEQYYAHADIGGMFDAEKRFGYRLNLLTQNGDTQIDEQTLRRNLISGSVDWRPTDNMVVELFLSKKDFHLEGRQFQFFLGGNLPDPLDGDQLYGPRDTYVDVDSEEASLRFAYAPTDQWAIRAALMTKKDTRSMVYAIGNLLPDDATVSFNLFGGRNAAETLGGYLYADYVFSTGPVDHRLTVGVNGYTYENSLAIQANGFPSFFDGPYTFDIADRSIVDFAVPVWNLSDSHRVVNGKSRNINTVVGDDITFDANWSMLVGANLSQIRSENFDFATGAPLPNGLYDESAVTPTVSVLYKPTTTVTTYLSYMESLEPGSIVGPTFTNANQILGPLRSKQVELGAKASINDILLTAALFQIDRASERSSDGTPTGTFVQDGREVHRGLEVSAMGKLTDELSLVAGLTVMDNEIRDSADPALEGKRPNGVADSTVKLYAEYAPRALAGWTFTGGVYVTGEGYQDPLNTRKISSYTLVDVGVRYDADLFGHNVVARVNLMNAGDEHYWAATSPGTPRTLAFSLSAGF
jgi:iron complex outermembrane receptor protein